MSRIVRRWALGSAIALVGAFGTACSSDADVGLPAGGEPTAGGEPSGVAPTVAATPSPGGGSNADVTAMSFSFEPSDISVGRSEELLIVNTDATVDHTFTIEGEGVDEIIPAGGEVTITPDLPTGTYTVICRFHVDQGMEATLEVG
ncbi:MAG TPA: cupredoxin domain-containing protein [Actinomycetota bacterium]|nr:cupredoxin domain-containing protein [Actinomycetota bacterium]